MANTTNFNWETPDDTDLVKDGAAAMRTLGNSIDTSFVDLKGGTTGQILSKASNTDLDYTWVTTDDANAIQNAIVDAKGDLIAATAADTPARLAVGTDYGFLQAFASESTGLLWNNAAWTSYTPTVSATGGTFTTVSATGKYTRVGKLCVAQVRVFITTNGTASGQVLASAPFQAKGTFQTWFVGAGREVNAAGFTITPRIAYGDSTFYITKVDGTYPGGNTYVLENTISYEVE
jgi:hypothetical protein